MQFQQRYVNMWPRAVRAFESGMIDLRNSLTHTFSLEDDVESFKTASKPKRRSIKYLSDHELKICD